MINKLVKTIQRLNTYNLRNIKSDEHGIKGNNKLPNTPIKNGIIIKGTSCIFIL